MYILYKEKYRTDDIPQQTINTYRTTFNRDFNIAFVKLKKDRCDLYEKYAIASEKDTDFDNEV